MAGTRRTRAMGASPGGLVALPMDAPTRKRRTRKESEETENEQPPPQPTTKKAGRKHPSQRKHLEDNVANVQREPRTLTPPTEDDNTAPQQAPPSKKQRVERVATTTPRRESTPRSQLEDDSPRNHQQDTPTQASKSKGASATDQSQPQHAEERIKITKMKIQTRADIQKRKQFSVDKLAKLGSRTAARNKQKEQEVTELSDCDDDEWAERVPSALGLDKTPNPTDLDEQLIKWAPDAEAMLVVKDENSDKMEEATRSKKARPSTSLPFILPYNSLPKPSKLKSFVLTDTRVIGMLAGLLHWLKDAPAETKIPTATETIQFVKNFNQEESQSEAESHTPQNEATEPTPPVHANSPTSASRDQATPPLSESLTPTPQQQSRPMSWFQRIKLFGTPGARRQSISATTSAQTQQPQPTAPATAPSKVAVAKEKDQRDAEKDPRTEQKQTTTRQEQTVQQQKEDLVVQGTVGQKRKRSVMVPKVFEGKLGPSTYGLPLNIGDTSSEEEIEIEVDDEDDFFSNDMQLPESPSIDRAKKLRPQINKPASQPATGRFSTPDVDDDDDDDDDDDADDESTYNSRPPKRARVESRRTSENRTEIALPSYYDEDVSSDDEWNISEAPVNFFDLKQPAYIRDMHWIRKRLTGDEAEEAIRKYKLAHKQMMRARKRARRLALKECKEFGMPVRDEEDARAIKSLHRRNFPTPLEEAPDLVFEDFLPKPDKERGYLTTTSTSENSSIISDVPGVRSQSPRKDRSLVKPTAALSPKKPRNALRDFVHGRSTSENTEILQTSPSKSSHDRASLPLTSTSSRDLLKSSTVLLPEEFGDPHRARPYTGEKLALPTQEKRALEKDNDPIYNEEVPIYKEVNVFEKHNKHAPKTPSRLREVQIMSPSTGNSQKEAPTVQEVAKKSIEENGFLEITTDAEVLAALLEVPEEDFAVFRHARSFPMDSVEREVAKYF